MTNYEAIQQMTPSHMAEFLDQVYLTGLHRGIAATRTANIGIFICISFLKLFQKNPTGKIFGFKYQFPSR